jgi:hypothetical protein
VLGGVAGLAGGALGFDGDAVAGALAGVLGAADPLDGGGVPDEDPGLGAGACGSEFGCAPG